MCKHLLRQPYIEEIVDDPLGSIAVCLSSIIHIYDRITDTDHLAYHQQPQGQ